MGQEIECKLRYQRRTLAGKAYLETDYILFRGEERLKVLFRDLKSVKAADGVLHLKYRGGDAAFELAKCAQEWADKIRNPPSRLDKLGVKPGLSVRLVGEFESDFLKALRERKIAWTEGASKSRVDLLFYSASASCALSRVAKLRELLQAAGALWVVYPKGVTAIREIDVIGAGRLAGLKDVKVASFSSTHTALKFVFPVTSR